MKYSFVIDRLFFASLLTKRKAFYYRNKFKREFTLNFLERENIMKNRLYKLLKILPKKVPYYKKYAEIFNELNKENPEIILKNLPILNKEDISDPFPFQNIDLNNKLINVKTNGSTGPSFIYSYDSVGADISSGITHACQELRFHNRVSYHEYISGEGNPTIKDNIREICKRWVLKKSIQVLPISSDDLNLEHQIIPNIRRKNFILQGHPSTIKLLARSLSRVEKDYLKNCKSIETTGELLTDFDREFIENTLNIPIVNRYGLAEAGIIAYQLNKSTNLLNILDTLFYVETDCEDSIIVTSFTNYGMPLIRYNTGDKGKIVTSGEGSKYLSITGGRKHDFITFEGLKISSSSLQDELSRINNIYEFQIIVNKKTDDLQIILDTDNNESFEDAKTLLSAFLPEKTVYLKDKFMNFKLTGARDKFQRIIYLNK